MMKLARNYFHRKWIKIILILTAMFIFGACYSCSRGSGKEDVLFLTEDDGGKGQPGEAVSGEETAMEEAAGEALPVCFVHICGAVERPGVYELLEGSRVFQAVELAGGFLPEADESGLNLAALISDGMKILVLTREEAETASAQEGEGAGKQGKVNINTASEKELMTLKGIGESRAKDIIAYREKHGRFSKIEDIMQVPGIKDGAFQKIKDDITV